MGFDYARFHQRSLYATETKGDIKRGMYFVCHNEDDEKRAKQLGYTSAAYVKSEWPKAACNKKTGAQKEVGRLQDSDEQNAKAVADLGPDWTLEYVAAPEPEPAAAPAAMGMGGAALVQLGEVIAEVRSMKASTDEGMTELANQIAELAEARLSQETRLLNLEKDGGDTGLAEQIGKLAMSVQAAVDGQKAISGRLDGIEKKVAKIKSE